jgi:hypothetical protein
MPIPVIEASHSATGRAGGRQVRALVQTGATETHYRRGGEGAVLLLLLAGGIEDSFGREVFARLAQRFRVIAPEVPTGVRGGAAGAGAAEPVSLSKWLRDLIDGLGLARPSLVVDEGVGVAALGFTLLDRDRVGALVTLHLDHADPAAPAGLAEGPLPHADRPLLVVRLDPRADADARAGAACDAVVGLLHPRPAASPRGAC